MEGVSIGYAPETPLLEGLNAYISGGERIVLTGANGSGKTTLLKTMVGELEPLVGRLRFGESIKPGYMAQEQWLLADQLSPLQIIQSNIAINETEARAFLHQFLFTGDDVLRPARELSFGERARLVLASLVVQGCNFLLLDEPINHLDIPSRSRFEEALSEFTGTILAVVHDRYFIERFATGLWVIQNHKLTSG
jgi:ATP-binding cassette subfamily F protein 3